MCVVSSKYIINIHKYTNIASLYIFYSCVQIKGENNCQSSTSLLFENARKCAKSKTIAINVGLYVVLYPSLNGQPVEIER